MSSVVTIKGSRRGKSLDELIVKDEQWITRRVLNTTNENLPELAHLLNHHPDFVILKSIRKINGDKPIRKKGYPVKIKKGRVGGREKYIVLDVETTGLPFSRHEDKCSPPHDAYNNSRITEISWTLMNGTRIEHSKSFLVRSALSMMNTPAYRKLIDDGHTRVEYDEVERDGKEWDEILRQLEPDLKATNKILGYNVGFDVTMILSELCMLNTPAAASIAHLLSKCEMFEVRRYYSETLAELYQFVHGKPLQNAHRAHHDVMAIVQCYNHKRYDIPSGDWIWGYGPMRGMTFEESYQNNPNYLRGGGAEFYDQSHKDHRLYLEYCRIRSEEENTRPPTPRALNVTEYVKGHWSYFTGLMKDSTLKIVEGGHRRRFTNQAIPGNLMGTFIDIVIRHYLTTETNFEERRVEGVLWMNDRLPDYYALYVEECYERVQENKDTMELLPELFELAIAVHAWWKRSCMRKYSRQVTFEKSDFASLFSECDAWKIQPMHVNPCLGDVNLLGDADLIADRTLIDIKCTKYEIKPNDFAQLIVYAALAMKKQITIDTLQIYNPLTGSIYEMKYEPTEEVLDY